MGTYYRDTHGDGEVVRDHNGQIVEHLDPDDPTPDYAAMAESMGITGYGPIEDPDELGPALRAAWADVQGGDPALVDVVCQPR